MTPSFTPFPMSSSPNLFPGGCGPSPSQSALCTLLCDAYLSFTVFPDGENHTHPFLAGLGSGGPGYVGCEVPDVRNLGGTPRLADHSEGLVMGAGSARDRQSTSPVSLKRRSWDETQNLKKSWKSGRRSLRRWVPRNGRRGGLD